MKNRKVLETLTQAQLIDLIEVYAKDWLALDGVWFQSIERKFGMDEAMYHDKEAWQRYTVIEARRIKAFLGLDLSVMPGLIALGLGVIAGIGLSIHAIRAALRKYRSQMVWLILGLMAGSLYAIVMGPAGLDAPQPPVSLQSFDWPGFILGIFLLLGLEALRRAQTPGPAAAKEN